MGGGSEPSCTADMDGRISPGFQVDSQVSGLEAWQEATRAPPNCFMLTEWLRCVRGCRRKQAAYNELIQRAERHSKVSRTAQRMAYEKEAMGKGRKRKLRENELAEGSSGQAPPVYEWKRERKK